MAEESGGPRTEVPRCGVVGGVDRWVGAGLRAGRQTGRGSVRHVGQRGQGHGRKMGLEGRAGWWI